MIAVSQSEDEIVACAEAGAAGFLPRDGGLEELEATVAGAIRGETVCSPQVSAVLLRRLTTLASGRAPTEDTAHLTPREREVLMLIERGMTNKQIATNLGIEVRTVKNHVHNLLEKLRVRRRGEAAARLRSARVPAFELLNESNR
jgi:DNA-binding NarL/FixJ family response regulator